MAMQCQAQFIKRMSLWRWPSDHNVIFPLLLTKGWKHTGENTPLSIFVQSLNEGLDHDKLLPCFFQEAGITPSGVDLQVSGKGIQPPPSPCPMRNQPVPGMVSEDKAAKVAHCPVTELLRANVTEYMLSPSLQGRGQHCLLFHHTSRLMPVTACCRDGHSLCDSSGRDREVPAAVIILSGLWHGVMSLLELACLSFPMEVMHGRE